VIRTSIMDQLLAKTEIEMPPAMLDRQLRALYTSAQKVLGESGKVLDRNSFEGLKADFKTQAERRVKEVLLVEQITRAENLMVTEADLNAQFEQIATQYGQSVPSVRAYYLQEGRLNQLVSILSEEKALEFLEKASTIAG
jgi:trigger factor